MENTILPACEIGRLFMEKVIQNEALEVDIKICGEDDKEEYLEVRVSNASNGNIAACTLSVNKSSRKIEIEKGEDFHPTNPHDCLLYLFMSKFMTYPIY